MATLTIPNVPPSVLANLAARAAAAKRTVEEEALALIEVHADPLIAHIFLTPEIPAPYDLELPGPGVPIIPRDIGTPTLEFWFDEDKVAE